MSHNPESPELAAAASQVKRLTLEISAAEVQLADCLNNLASEQGMLESILSTTETPKNKEYLEAARIACKAGIKAWSLNIAACQHDIDNYKSEINAILERNPEARQDK